MVVNWIFQRISKRFVVVRDKLSHEALKIVTRTIEKVKIAEIKTKYTATICRFVLFIYFVVVINGF